MTLVWSAATTDDEPRARDIGRWTVSLLAVVAIHALGVAAMLTWKVVPPLPLEPPPAAIMIELAPLPAPTPPVIQPPKLPEPEPLPELPPEIVPPPKPVVVLPPKPKPKPPVQRQPEPVPQHVEPAPPAPARPPDAIPAPFVSAPAPRAEPTYNGILMAHLLRHLRFPREARARGLSGTATVRFTVDRNGKVLAFALEHGAGNRMLDEEALATIRRSEPLPPFPPDSPEAQREFVVPLRFDLLRATP